VIPLWWDIIKNAKLSGKAKGKGTSFDASKIKINVDKDDCKKELKKILSSALKYTEKSHLNVIEEEYIDNKLSEEVACAFVKALKFKLPQQYGMRGATQTDNITVLDNRSDKIMLSRNGVVARILNQPDMVSVALKAYDEEIAPSAIIEDYGGKFKQISDFFFTVKDYSNWVKSI